MAVEVAYAGSYADHVGRAISTERYVPEQYYSSATNVRDTTRADACCSSNVTNPFRIANFASLAGDQPALYQRMAGKPFFTSRDDAAAEPAPRIPAADGSDLQRTCRSGSSRTTRSRSR